MGFTSGFGTMFAAPTGALAVLRGGQEATSQRRWFGQRLGAALILVAFLPGAAPTSTLDVSIDKLRSDRGLLRICLTADPSNFPGCVDDANAVTRTVPASVHAIHFDGLPYGRYAVAVIHDANSNNKLDTMLGIPREGFGFSRNPVIGFGAPRFAAARFEIGETPHLQEIRMRYLL